jgi:hypothetical protein
LEEEGEGEADMEEVRRMTRPKGWDRTSRRTLTPRLRGASAAGSSGIWWRRMNLRGSPHERRQPDGVHRHAARAEGHQPGRHGCLGDLLMATTDFLSFLACWFVSGFRVQRRRSGQAWWHLEQKVVSPILWHWLLRWWVALHLCRFF